MTTAPSTPTNKTLRDLLFIPFTHPVMMTRYG